ncbi:hypothetical protein [Agrobacterium tumefaciens]|uniref:hypothetical protein n=1 Tax=Agrobacterium tumefaciens TaxID=358 RepID=UPI001573AF18|nr:hypothetical protein [Agrobacterium tumefaciens]
MTKTEFPRQKIAAQISDLRQMRGAISDLISTACGLVGRGEGVPDACRLELLVALNAAERADQIAQDRMRELYAMPTPTVANQNEQEAAA